VGRHSGGRPLGGTAAVRAFQRGRPQHRRVRVEAQHDPAPTLFYERREPVREVLQPFTAFFRAEPAENRGTLLAAIWIRSPVWVDALACTAIGHGELSEAGEADLSATLQRALDDRQDRVDGGPGITLRKAGLGGHLIDEL